MPLQFTTTGAVAVTLSNGNKTATSTAASGFGAGAYLNEVVAGKCCFAMRFDGLADGGNIVELIAAATGLDFANYSIVGTYISEFTNVSLANSNGSPSGATLSGAAPIVNSDVIFVCIDEPNNLTWVYKNGTIVSGAGNPAAGTGGLSGFLISGARTPAAALSSAGAAMTVIDDPVAAGITVPSGFTYLGYSTPPTNPPSNTSVPTLSDTTPVVGQVITAGSDTWTESPTSFGVQFYVDGSPVGSRSSTRTYTVQAADAGKALSVGVIATNAIGDSTEAFSTSSSPIAHTWQLVGVAVSAVNASGNYTLTLPSGSQSGDVVVAAIAMRSNVGFTVPAGWTRANQDTGGNTTNNTTASDTSSLQAYIIRGGSAPSMVFTRTGGSRALGVVAVYRYTDQSAPPTFDTSVLTPLGAAATAISGTGLTTGAAGELIVGAVFGARNITVSNFRATNPATGSGSTDTTANPADGAWTERADSLNGTSPTVGIFLADAVRTSAGATGSLLATASASALHAIGAMAFAPPSGGVSGTAAQQLAGIGQSATGAVYVAGSTTGSLALTQTSAGSVPATGAAAQQLSFGQTATGKTVNDSEGQAAQTLTLGQSATGAVYVAGQSAGTVTMGQTATGSSYVAGQAAGQTVALGQSATGATYARGSAAQSLGLGQSASGKVDIRGSASQTLTMTQTAVSSGEIRGAAAQTLGIQQVATVSVELRSQASQTVTMSQVATGSVYAAGQAVQSLAVGQGATGSSEIRGQASQTVTMGQTAIGFSTNNVYGQADQTVSLASSAQGKVDVAAQAQQQLAIGQAANAAVAIKGVAETSFTMNSGAFAAVDVGGVVSQTFVMQSEAIGEVRVTGQSTGSFLLQQYATSLMVDPEIPVTCLDAEVDADICLGATADVESDMAATADIEYTLKAEVDIETCLGGSVS